LVLCVCAQEEIEIPVIIIVTQGHGTHGILPAAQREAPTHPFNAIRLCGDCHKTHTVALENGMDGRQHVQSYLDSVHGRGISAGGLVFAATCADCHGYHAVLHASDPLASTHREQIPTTCGRCHLGVVETYQTSIHGALLAEGDVVLGCSSGSFDGFHRRLLELLADRDSPR